MLDEVGARAFRCRSSPSDRPAYAGNVQLNLEQRRAVDAVRGPVCILAGAGSGKTTTITHRIANQVTSGAFRADEILAVTFTDKAAGELRARLEALGARGVTARTFHAAALGQLHQYAPDRVGKIVSSKALPLRRIANSLPGAYRFRPAGDLATEIEWAKNRRITPARYRAELGEHEPPIPPDLMRRVYAQYEERKAAAGYADFEDLLELAIQLYSDDEVALGLLRERFRAFTGASPEHLLEMPKRFPNAVVIRLEENYRSSPQVLALANRLVPQLGGAEKTLRATRAGGPEPELRACEDEAAFAIERIRALELPHEQIAILCRTNARLVDFEEALHEAGIPAQGASLLGRESARYVLRRLASPGDVRRLAEERGWLENPPDKLGEREVVRQNDLGRLVRLAEELADLDGPGFVAELERRFGDGGESRRGVHLLTLHGAKGLEFEAVFVARVEEKELPVRQAKTPDAIAEERRLFYVGLTRAKWQLFVTWTRTPSRFVRELGLEPRQAPQRREADPDDPVFAALKQWRLERARTDEVPAYVVFHNSTLAEIAGRKPQTLSELAAVPGVGPSKLERFGDDVLAILDREVASPAP